MGRYTAADDISEDDLEEREKLRQAYIALRLSKGILPEALAKEHGFNRTLVSQFENRTNWQAKTAQQHARMLNAQLLLEPRDLPLSLPPDSESEMLRLMRPKTDEARDLVHYAVVKNYLIRARNCIGLSQLEIGQAMNRSKDSVQIWERDVDPTNMVYTVQRYARALGGSLGLRLDPRPKGLKR